MEVSKCSEFLSEFRNSQDKVRNPLTGRMVRKMRGTKVNPVIRDLLRECEGETPEYRPRERPQTRCEKFLSEFRNSQDEVRNPVTGRVVKKYRGTKVNPVIRDLLRECVGETPVIEGETTTDFVKEELMARIEREDSMSGVFRNLLFTHNTPYISLLMMIEGQYEKHIRCCTSSGSPIGRGAQFRHGLDSQYGDVIFVMKAGPWWSSMPGVDAFRQTKTQDPQLGRFWDKTIRGYDIYKNSIENELELEALIYDFRRPEDRGNGTECVPYAKKKQISWCNTQLHLGANVPLEYVDTVLVPRWIKENPVGAAKNPRLQSFLSGNYRKNDPLKELSKKVKFYGPSMIKDFYSYLTFPITDKKTYYPGTELMENVITHTTRNPYPLGSSSKLSLGGDAFRSAEKMYMELLVERGMASNYLEILSYNVYFKSMIGAIPPCSGTPNPCVKHINDVVGRRPFDVICLQEASNLDAFRSRHPTQLFKHRSGEEDIVILSGERLIPRKMAKGEFERGRPFLAVKFSVKGYGDRKLCVITVHNSHKGPIANSFLERILGELEYNQTKDFILLCGDFNYENVKVELFGTKLEEIPPNVPTCCLNQETLEGTMRRKYDHILVGGSKLRSVEILPFPTPASDHAPLFGVMELP